MSTGTTHIDYTDPVTGEYNGPAFDEHDKRYLRVAAILGVLTAVEIVMSYVKFFEGKGGLLAAVLMSMGAVKFVIVAGEFMHLKFDKPIVKRLFVVGAILACFCYTAVLTAMGALHTPRALLPIHWWVYLVGSIIAIVVWVVPRKGADHDHDDHGDHAGHDDHAQVAH
jgi:cytochrome c oxidase subunit IV